MRIGGLGMGGLSLPGLLQAEQLSGVKNSKKAVIMIYMAGAPPHQDMYDLKMDAPKEMRGEFRPIPTNVPGIEICELMPRMAKIMDKCVPIRSLYGAPNGSHDSFMCYTGKVGSTLDTIGQPAGWMAVDRSGHVEANGADQSECAAFRRARPQGRSPALRLLGPAGISRFREWCLQTLRGPGRVKISSSTPSLPPASTNGAGCSMPLTNSAATPMRPV